MKIEDRKWRYLVTLRPGVSIAPSRFAEIVEVDRPDPLSAIAKAIDIWKKMDASPEDAEYTTHAWQSDDLSIRVERVA